jgi:hypothetical protein
MVSDAVRVSSQLIELAATSPMISPQIISHFPTRKLLAGWWFGTFGLFWEVHHPN